LASLGNFDIKIWQRAVVFGVLCIAAVFYLASTASDETHLEKSPLRALVNDYEAAYLHAITSGFRILGFKPEEDGVLTIQSKAVYPARAAFLLKAYTFLKKVYADPRCDRVRTIKLYPYAYFDREDGTQGLGPFAGLVLTRSGAEEIDWSEEFPDLSPFKQALLKHGTLQFDRASVP